MYLNRIIAILGFLFGRRRKRALCPIPVSERLRCLFVAAAVLLSARAAEASVLIPATLRPPIIRSP